MTPGRLFAIGAAIAAAGCGAGVERFPLAEPMWRDPDRRPFPGPPAEYYSPFGWDAADQTLFRPISRFFAVDPAGEAVDVNSMDEVPDSSWFTNRIGLHPVSSEALARGACPEEVLDPEAGPWTVTSAKPNGANPGFIVEDTRGDRWLLKFDGTEQPERATSADVIGSRVYWAAGYHAPCNVIVHFDPAILEIAPDAESENEAGDEVPMTASDIDRVLAKGVRVDDTRYRASASLFLSGQPIGPFRYQGTRDDDPNDVIPHEDRRELRGMYVLASWLNHFDSREQNTLDTWIDAGDGRGWVRHHVIDFGDCFGSQWEYEGITRRLGHAYYLDIPYLVEDFLTLGTLPRPWDDPGHGPAGAVLGHYSVDRFDPDAWRPGYPNPAFSRMSERDAAWMARIVARFDDTRIATMVEQARTRTPVVRSELQRILEGRRDAILRRWLARLSALSHPRLADGGVGVRICLEDLAVTGGVVQPSDRGYEARAWTGPALDPTPLDPPTPGGPEGARVCLTLPPVPGAAPDDPAYLVVDVADRWPADDPGARPAPARVHLYHLGGSAYRIVGLERPDDGAPPPS